MEKSESIKSLAKALILFNVKVEKIGKDANNPFFKSKYASLSNILDAIKEPLSESGLCFTQMPNGETGLITLLMHGETGEYIQCEYSMQPVKNDPQARGSAITYQRRYALAATLGLNIDEDDDGNGASKGTPAKQQQQPQNNGTPPQSSNPPKEDDGKPWLNKTNKDGSLTETWLNVTKALVNGGYTIENVSAKYKISKENRAELSSLKN